MQRVFLLLAMAAQVQSADIASNFLVAAAGDVCKGTDGVLLDAIPCRTAGATGVTCSVTTAGDAGSAGVAQKGCFPCTAANAGKADVLTAHTYAAASGFKDGTTTTPVELYSATNTHVLFKYTCPAAAGAASQTVGAVALAGASLYMFL